LKDFDLFSRPDLAYKVLMIVNHRRIKFNIMKISLVQTDTVWEDRVANLGRIESLIQPLRGMTDIIILPEMFSTGFSTDPRKLAEEPEGTTRIWMRRMAAECSAGICGSYIVKDKERFYNRFVFVSPDNNDIWHYDKRHLFGLGDENRYFMAGNTRLTFAFRGVRIRPVICYDLRFPVWSRNRNDYDLFICPANWPGSRHYAWNSLLRARAIENMCFVAGVNRVGTDGNGISYNGGSVILNYTGDMIAGEVSGGEGTVTAEIQLGDLSEFRTRFPFLKDADDFTLIP
jgi:omega-amidase